MSVLRELDLVPDWLSDLRWIINMVIRWCKVMSEGDGWHCIVDLFVISRRETGAMDISEKCFSKNVAVHILEC